MNKTVAVLRCENYEPALILDKMREAYLLSGGSDVLDVAGKKVLLKPNILRDRAVSKAVTTHPEFLRAAIRLMKELGAAKIYVGDSPGFQIKGSRAKNCGIWDVCQDEDIEWYDFSSRITTISSPNGQVINQFQVSDIVDKVDLIISLPKLKTHQLMYFTGAIKNQFGLLPGFTKSPMHMLFPGRNSFAKMIVDLHEAVNPAFAFMDGIISMEGPGPGNGNPVLTKLLLASSNLLALDITACKIIGYAPDIIPINREAVDRSIWLESSDDIETAGLNLKEAKVHQFQKIIPSGSKTALLEYYAPKFIKRFDARLQPKPVFSKERCIQCGACVKICPAEALKINGMVKINYDKCIRCFCCHEVCPENAITVKRTIRTSGVMH